jgi:hypothetical protein
MTDWIPCVCCGARYRSRAAALQCCSESFDDPDDPAAPPVATDGGQSPARMAAHVAGVRDSAGPALTAAEHAQLKRVERFLDALSGGQP